MPSKAPPSSGLHTAPGWSADTENASSPRRRGVTTVEDDGLVIDQSLLFSSGDLRDYLARVAHKADQELLDYDPDELLLAAEADVSDYLI